MIHDDENIGNEPDGASAQLAREIRRLRKAADLSQPQLAAKIGYSRQYVSLAERPGKGLASAELVRAIDRALGAGGQLIACRDRAATERRAVRHHDAGTPEPLDADDAIVVPARTSDGRVIYVSVSRRLFLQSAGSAALRRATAPSPRQDRSTTHMPTEAAPVIDTNPAVHFQRMRQILIDSDNLFGSRRLIPTVLEQIQIMHSIRLTRQRTDRRDLAMIQSQYAEFCGWLYQDMGNYDSARYWMDRAIEWSYAGRDHDLTVFILARKAQLAGDMREHNDAIDSAEAALAMAPTGSRLAAVAATYAAHGYALNGDRLATERAYDEATSLLDAAMPEPALTWGQWLDEPYIAVQRARSLTVLGDCHSAAEEFQAAINALPHGYTRDRGVYLARAAVAFAEDREAERAAELGLEALAIGTKTGSGRIMNELAQLDDVLIRQGTSSRAADFRTAMRDALAHQVDSPGKEY